MKRGVMSEAGIVLSSRVARFFKAGQNIPINQKKYQMTIKYGKWL
jgi:hypothetical protein